MTDKMIVAGAKRLSEVAPALKDPDQSLLPPFGSECYSAGISQYLMADRCRRGQLRGRLGCHRPSGCRRSCPSGHTERGKTRVGGGEKVAAGIRGVRVCRGWDKVNSLPFREPNIA